MSNILRKCIFSVSSRVSLKTSLSPKTSRGDCRSRGRRARDHQDHVTFSNAIIICCLNNTIEGIFKDSDQFKNQTKYAYVEPF